MPGSDRDLSAEDVQTLTGWKARLDRLPHLYRYTGVQGQRFAWFHDLALRSVLYFPRYAELNDPFDGAVDLHVSGTPDEIRRLWEGRLAEVGEPHDAKAEARIQNFIDERDAPETQKWLHDAHQREATEHGVACFSEAMDDLPMWAYYADAHRGICLRFSTRHLLRETGQGLGLLVPVTYADDYPKAGFYQDTAFRRTQVSLSTKAGVWSHEKEWRILRREGPGPVPFQSGRSRRHHHGLQNTA